MVTLLVSACGSRLSSSSFFSGESTYADLDPEVKVQPKKPKKPSFQEAEETRIQNTTIQSRRPVPPSSHDVPYQHPVMTTRTSICVYHTKRAPPQTGARTEYRRVQAVHIKTASSSESDFSDEEEAESSQGPPQATQPQCSAHSGRPFPSGCGSFAYVQIFS